MFTVKHTDGYGWAGYADGHRVTKWTAFEGEARVYLTRLVTSVARDRARWEEEIRLKNEPEEKVLAWIKELETNKIIHRADRRKYIDRKKMAAHKMHEGVFGV